MPFSNQQRKFAAAACEWLTVNAADKKHRLRWQKMRQKTHHRTKMNKGAGEKTHRGTDWRKKTVGQGAKWELNVHENNQCM